MRSLDRLTEADRPLIAGHLLRLDESDRKLRFGSPLTDAAIVTHVDRLDLSRGHHLGYFQGAEFAGLAELFAETDTTRCEIALSVDAPARHRGIGGRLLARAQRIAATLGYRHVDLFICTRNAAMRHLARAQGFTISSVDGETIASRDLHPALPAHLMSEAFDTSQAIAWQLMAAGWAGWAQMLGGTPATGPAAPDRVSTAPSTPQMRALARPRDGLSVSRAGSITQLTLDRADKLNALNRPMVSALHAALDAAERDPSVAAILVEGSGDTAFSAGGDVRAVREAQLKGTSCGAHFFHDLYALTHRIHALTKPYVALIDGITMGGGLGVSMHGTHRVATEHTAAAMPENRIGFFTDVGASYVLPRLPGEIGTYMALTGARLTAADACAVGLATHHVPAARIPALKARLAEHVSHTDAATVIDRQLARLETTPGSSALLAQRPVIDRCFGQNTVEEIVQALMREDSDWARHTLAVLHQQCPTSLKVTLAALRRGARLNFRSCMAMEHGLCQTLIARPDFAEGVRAQLVDKCRQPAWQPARLEDVSDQLVARCFARRRAVPPAVRQQPAHAPGAPDSARARPVSATALDEPARP